MLRLKADDNQATAKRATSPCCIVDVSLTSDPEDAEVRQERTEQ